MLSIVLQPIYGSPRFIIFTMKRRLPCPNPYTESFKRRGVSTVREWCPMKSTPPYLAEGPEGFQNSWDILLSLDDGNTLPAHSQILARCIPVFAGMVDGGGPLTKASAANVISVPFSDCSLVEATNFISAIYSLEPHLQIDKTSALAIARLGDKYSVKVDRATYLNEHFYRLLGSPPLKSTSFKTP